MVKELEVHLDRKSWAKSVKYVLETFGFADVWVIQVVADTSTFMPSFLKKN